MTSRPYTAFVILISLTVLATALWLVGRELDNDAYREQEMDAWAQ